MATMLLSLGVGAVTAAFTLLNGVGPHSATYSARWMPDSPAGIWSCGLPSLGARQGSANMSLTAVRRAHVADVYETSYETAGDALDDAVDTWSDVADEPGARPLAPILAVGALAMLVACTRGAARLLDAPEKVAIVAGYAIGALIVSATLISVFGLPSLGIRAVLFAIGASMLTARFARSARKELVSAKG